LHRRFVFTDPVAFRYLEEDPSTVVLERRGRLKGYQLYLVEQWACSRVHPTFVVTTYTGDEKDSVIVGVLGVPADESSWSAKLRVYFKAVSQYHARSRDTPLGSLMVTNLSGFPSALTVIPVPDGDIKKHREDFIVNENLKRLGCSGRSGLNLSEPGGATQAKFHQLYRTSDRIPLYNAVIELVKLCQVALMMFGKLEQEYADGLLCDVTERAISDWWTEFGSEYYNAEPNDGILGPTTVAALLGMLMGARNRLSYLGAPVNKDVFDIGSLKRGIAHFQKSQKLPRTRRLDRQTLSSLRRVTAKAAAGEGWVVPKAVKSTVAELSGKGGEMVMGMVTGREKAGIGDIETLDIERFVSLVQGDRSKWLWRGKNKRSANTESFGKTASDSSHLTFSADDTGGYVWSNKKQAPKPVDESVASGSQRADVSEPAPDKVTNQLDPTSSASVIGDKDGQPKKTVLKSVTGKMSDARSGFERIKDAVGRRGHTGRHSKDEGVDFYSSLGTTGGDSQGLSTESFMMSAHPGGLNRTFTWKNKPEEYENGYPKDESLLEPLATLTRMQKVKSFEDLQGLEEPKVFGHRGNDSIYTQDGKIISNVDCLPSFRKEGEDGGDMGRQHGIIRRRSMDLDRPIAASVRNGAHWPRHLSFSEVEDAIIVWKQPRLAQNDATEEGGNPLPSAMLTAGQDEWILQNMFILQTHLNTWVQSKVSSVIALEAQANRDQEALQRQLEDLNDSYHDICHKSTEFLTQEKMHMAETLKELEALNARMAYEVGTLQSKVADVEDGVAQFEAQVVELEVRAVEFERLLHREGFWHWIFRSVTGIGTKPEQR
jgi:hypothetical protein